MTEDWSVRRGQRVYDRWANAGVLYGLVDWATRGLRTEAVSHLGVEPGDTVVDLGCGPGASLALLSDAVSPGGTVVGVDYSEGMVRRAGSRAGPNVSVIRADAASLPLVAGSVDGVFASLALSAMPDLRGTLDSAERVLAPGGRLVVLDGRTPNGIVGSALERAYRWLVNFQNGSLLSTLRDRYDDVAVPRRFDAGLGFLAVAVPSPEGPSP